jgi:alkylation response protein AidB-like acyl-CoA dehydrogenase
VAVVDGHNSNDGSGVRMIDFAVPIQDFRAQVQAWLGANFPANLPSVFDEGGLEAHVAWERQLAGAGLAAPHWPTRYGGKDADEPHRAVFLEECARALVPERLNRMALGLLGPTLIEFGSEEQRERYLPRILTCDDRWCQGFSEPEAGSDLARVSTRAVRDGDEFIITGEKIWTSLAVYANWMFALVRTAGRPGDHAGLTFLLVPLSAPGVSVRPIRQLHGEPGFAQVYLGGARVPVSNVVGDIDSGWSVAMACLGYERGSGLGSHVQFSQDVTNLVWLAAGRGAAVDPVVRDAIAARFVETEIFRHYVQAQTGSGGDHRQLSSVTKLYWSEMQARIFETAFDVLGPLAEVDEDEAPTAWIALHRRYWHARGGQIFAGTSEIQRNIIAERLLGLPKEPRPAQNKGCS